MHTLVYIRFENSRMDMAVPTPLYSEGLYRIYPAECDAIRHC